jgi:putative Ca2+/H+ antiporter (TMEM165/GDT1 family)
MQLTPLITSFALIFLAELGDKTLYVVLVLASRYRAIPVLLGAMTAFVIQGVIAVGLGSLVGQLPNAWVRWLTATVFFIFGLLLLFKNEGQSEDGTERTDSSFVSVFARSFALVFAAEWGDATQIGTAALVARFRAPFSVFIGATLGLWAGAALATFVGRAVGQRLPTRLLRRAAGLLFCGFAILTLLRA